MTETVALKIVQRIAAELSVQPRQVAAAVQLLDEGATVPFIARYRKEVTDNLDDTQLRNLEERLLYLRELEDRRAAIVASIDEQGKLTDELRNAIEGADSKQVLEDLYLPYKPKRRTRAQIAREAGLQPLADALLGNPLLDPQTEAAVEHALSVLARGRTVITIAHRLSTAERADRVAVMEHGHLVEIASHDELVARGDHYARLWASWQAGLAV